MVVPAHAEAKLLGRGAQAEDRRSVREPAATTSMVRRLLTSRSARRLELAKGKGGRKR